MSYGRISIVACRASPGDVDYYTASFACCQLQI